MSTPLRMLVTGGNSGLGLATIKYFLRNRPQAMIVGLDKNIDTDCQSQPGFKQGAGARKLMWIKADVTDQCQVEAALEKVRTELGSLDLLVNCAGIARAFLTYNHSKKRRFSMDDFEAVLKTNVIGTFSVIRSFVELMVKQDLPEDGSETQRSSVIINLSSIAAFEGQQGQTAYSASKGAIAALTVPLAREFSNYGIRVCCIAPGVFDTPLVGALSETSRRILSKIMVYPKRMGRPEEFAHMVEFLYDNQYMNGEVVRLDGATRLTM